MKLVFLFLILSFTGYAQMPISSNYNDFISGIHADNAVGVRLDKEGNQYGQKIHETIYQEVMPVGANHFLFFSQRYESVMEGSTNLAPNTGSSFVCMCEKGDLTKVLNRWKDGQYGAKDYAPFDCKYRSFSKLSEMYSGQSFWSDIRPLARLKELADSTETVLLLDKKETVKVVVFKNKKSSKKKVVKVGYSVPCEDAVKVLEEESYLTSVKNEQGKELLDYKQGLGWKGLFMDWKDYRLLNSGFWGVPRANSYIRNGEVSQSFSVGLERADNLTLSGQTTFLVRQKQKKTKLYPKISLGESTRIIKAQAYLDFGEQLEYGVSGFVKDKQQISVSFSSILPISKITAFDVNSGKELAQTSKQPFEMYLPNTVKNIRLEVVYSDLKRVKVLYTAYK